MGAKIDPPAFLDSPRVVATVHRADDLTLPVSGDVCDLLEYRLDNLRGCLDDTGRSLAASPLPCLITARHPAEGGAGDLDAATRRALLLRFLPQAALVDVEVRSLHEFSDVIAAARAAGVGLVASYHDFEKTPPPGELQSAIESARAVGADAVKLALRLRSTGDFAALLLFTDRVKKTSQRIAAMGMGPLGKVSRLALAAAGSCLNYGYLHEPNAPGQWPAAELKRLIAETRPGPGQ